MKKLSLFIALIVCSIVCLQSSGIAITQAGTTIESYAEIRYAGREIVSNLITHEVGQIFGLELDPMSSEASVSPGETYYFPHVLTNVGNGSDLITFSIIEVTPETWSANLVYDKNFNGVYDSGFDVIIGQSTSEPRSEESAYYFLIQIITSATSEASGYAVLRVTSEANDGPSYFGANGSLFGGDDVIQIKDELASELTNLSISRNDSTGDIILSWEGTSADIYYLESFSSDFSSASLEASNVSSPYISSSVEAQDGNTRFYRIAPAGSTAYALGIMGKFDVPVSVGINQLSLPLIPSSNAISNVIGTQVTGATNAFDADRVWKYNSSSPSGYDIAWLVGGVGPPYDGQWYTGNYPTTLTIGPDEGFILQIREGHSASYITFVGSVSNVDRSIPVSVGMNFIGTCFPVEVPLGDQASTGDSNLWESGATGATNAFDADRVWKYNPSAPAGYDFAWLVDGVNPTYNGKWYTGNYPTTMKLQPGLGYWIQVREGHSGFTWTYKKPY